MIATGFRPLRTPVSDRPASATAACLDPALCPRSRAPLWRSHHRLAAARPVPPAPHLPYTRRPSRVQVTAIGCTHGCTPASRADAYSMWTTSPGMWTARRPEIFSAHRPWTASTQVAGLLQVKCCAVSPPVSSACAQSNRRVCTEFPQGCAHRDWTREAGHYETVVATYYN